MTIFLDIAKRFVIERLDQEKNGQKVKLSKNPSLSEGATKFSRSKSQGLLRKEEDAEQPRSKGNRSKREKEISTELSV